MAFAHALRPYALMLRFAAVSVSLLCASPAQAQAYPSKPITIISAFAPGGTIDFLGRLLMQKVTDNTGWRFILESKAGANGHIGTDYAAKAPPDGYTLLLGASSTHAINPALFKDLKYDVVRDFAPLTPIASTANLMAVHPSTPATSVAELIAYAKANPGKLAFGSGGAGTSIHLSGEMFKSAAGIDLLHVPYKGSGPAVAAALGGQVQILFENVSAAIQHVQAGRLRALAITSKERHPLLPNVPTLNESGLPGFEIEGWFAMFAPSATPRPILARLNDEFVKALRAPDVEEQLRSRTMTPRPMSQEQFAAFWKSEREKFAAVVTRANIKID